MPGETQVNGVSAQQGAQSFIVSEFWDDPEISDLVGQFVGELPQRVSALQARWQERDLEMLKRLAHQLKGACGGFGFPVLSASASKLEDDLRQLAIGGGEAPLAAIQRDLDELMQLCARVRQGAPE